GGIALQRGVEQCAAPRPGSRGLQSRQPPRRPLPPSPARQTPVRIPIRQNRSRPPGGFPPVKILVLTADANTLVYHRGDLLRDLAARDCEVVTAAAEDYPHVKEFLGGLG